MWNLQIRSPRLDSPGAGAKRSDYGVPANLQEKEAPAPIAPTQTTMPAVTGPRGAPRQVATPGTPKKVVTAQQEAPAAPIVLEQGAPLPPIAPVQSESAKEAETVFSSYDESSSSPQQGTGGPPVVTAQQEAPAAPIVLEQGAPLPPIAPVQSESAKEAEQNLSPVTSPAVAPQQDTGGPPVGAPAGPAVKAAGPAVKAAGPAVKAAGPPLPAQSPSDIAKARAEMLQYPSETDGGRLSSSQDAESPDPRNPQASQDTYTIFNWGRREWELHVHYTNNKINVNQVKVVSRAKQAFLGSEEVGQIRQYVKR